MAGATCSSFPSSLQLRLAMNYRRRVLLPPAVLVIVRSRVWNPDRPGVIRLGPSMERDRRGSLLFSASGSAADGFAGWSESDGGEEKKASGPAASKKWLAGGVGAGVAGIILVAGLTFAALSLSKSNSSRSKQRMEPLTTQQEVSLASESQQEVALALEKEDGKVEENKIKESNVKPDDCSLESTTGMHIDLSSSQEPYEEPSDDKLGESNEVPSIDNAESITTSDSVQEDSPYVSTFDDKSVDPEITSSLLDLPASEIVDCSIAANLPKLTSEIEENSVNPQPANLSDATNLNIDLLGKLPSSMVTQSSDPSLDCSNSTLIESNELVALDISVASPLDTTLDTLISPKDDVETVALICNAENIQLTKRPQDSAESISSSLELKYVNQNGTSEATSVLAPTYPVANEEDVIASNEITGSKTFFETATSESCFSSAGIPAPSIVAAGLQAHPGRVLVPAVVDQVQGQALAALQVLKVIEADVRPSDLCTRREYARWLVVASSALSRSTVSKVYPAMYIENATELAFDDITPDDPDFSSIQGLAEAGLIASKLSIRDLRSSSSEDEVSFYFYPESPLSRQDLVSWKMALEKRQLPEPSRKILYQLSGFRDIDKINPEAWPALIADLSSGDQGIISLAFGCTRLFQPDKPVTKSQAAVALATGEASDVVSEELTRIEAESMAENAVSAHNALVAQVEKDINASFEKELSMEKEKISAVEKLAEEARQELERLKAEREEENVALMKERAAIESEMEVLSRLRHEVEEQLQSLMGNKVEISFEKERISKLQKEAEYEKQEISRLQYDLEVERKALSMARAWAEDEAKRAREQAKALEEARDRWERHGIKVVVDSDLQAESAAGVTWLTAGKELSAEGTVSRAENLVDKLKLMACNIKGKSKEVIDMIINKIVLIISTLKEQVLEAGSRAKELKDATFMKARESIRELQQNTSVFSSAIKEKARGSIQELQQSTAEFSIAIKDGARRVAGDCKEGVEKLTQKFKS